MKKIAVLSSDKDFIDGIKLKVDNFNHFIDSISLLTFSLLNKPEIIIIDTSDLPANNENKIIKSLNDIVPKSKIMLLLRNDDIEFLRMLRKNNNIFFSFNHPEEFLQIFEIIDKIEKNKEKVGG
uniref:Response regulatory domain-containing protein n=1 Tax=candidate division WOR-3 bacterium TaxID=2052148 RepID=A0A7C3NFH6_UNCW3